MAFVMCVNAEGAKERRAGVGSEVRRVRQEPGRNGCEGVSGDEESTAVQCSCRGELPAVRYDLVHSPSISLSFAKGPPGIAQRRR